MKGVGDLLNKLEGVKKGSGGEYAARCPAHEDRHASLSVKQESDRILVNCHAGCSPEAIMARLGLTVADLFIKDDKPFTPAPKEPAAKIVATYDYVDETGKPLFQVCRLEPKSFRQRHRNGNDEWQWNLEGVRRVIYRLPEVLKADTVYLVEGEKDADNMAKQGLCATTSAMGAGNWKSEYGDFLKGKRVILIPDRDTAGMEYARQVAASIEDKSTSVAVVLLPTDGGVKDVSDWLQRGGKVADLSRMEQAVDVLYQDTPVEYRMAGEMVEWRCPCGVILKAERISQERTGTHARIVMEHAHRLLSYSYFNIDRDEDRVRLANSASKAAGESLTKEALRRDLDRFCAGLWQYQLRVHAPEELEGALELKPPNYRLRPYVLDGGGTILFGPPGRGKSFMSLLMLVSIDAGVSKFWPVQQSKCLFINLERDRESIIQRVGAINRILGLPANRKLFTLNARGKSLSDVAEMARKGILEKGVKVVLLDSISRSGLGDLNENRSSNAIVDCLNSLSRTWIGLAHTPRADETHVFGSVHFDAGADIMVQLMSELAEDGRLGVALKVTKGNDIPRSTPKVHALDFNECGLAAVREAKVTEFPELLSKDELSMAEMVVDDILEHGASSATDIAERLGFNRSNITDLLRTNKTFRFSGKDGRKVLYDINK